MYAFVGILAVFLAGSARCAAAQEEFPTASLALVAGPTHYSLQARHSGRLLALRLASPLVPLGTYHWLVEPSLATSRTGQTVGSAATCWCRKCSSRRGPVRPRCSPMRAWAAGSR